MLLCYNCNVCGKQCFLVCMRLHIGCFCNSNKKYDVSVFYFYLQEVTEQVAGLLLDTGTLSVGSLVRRTQNHILTWSADTSKMQAM